MKTIVKLEIIVIIQGNIQVLHIAYVVQNIVYLKMFLQLFMMDQIQLSFFHKRVSRRIQKNNLLVQEKTLKSTLPLQLFLIIKSCQYLSEGIHKIKCKHRHDDEKCETCAIKYRYCGCLLEYTNFKNDLRKYKCLCCNKSY